LISPGIFCAFIFGGLLLLICLRVPIAISLITISLVGLFIIGDIHMVIDILGTVPFSRVASWSLLPIPLFILMGHLAFAAGITTKAYKTASNWLGWLPGGLGLATMGACGLFAACSGSSAAMAGTMGRLALPEMLNKKYDSKFATGTVASGSLLGIMIPPSVVFVIYGIVTETSISRLLLAGVIPGLLTLLVFSAYIIIRAVINPNLAPAGNRTSWKTKILSIKDIWGVAIIAAVILGGIYSGIFTPSEAAAVGAFIGLIFAIFQGRKSLPLIIQGFRETVTVSAMIFFLIIGAGLLSFTISIAGVPQWFAACVTEMDVSPLIILAFIIIIYFVLGMFVDTISMMLVTLPVVFPVIIELGYDPIWFGVLIVKFNELGLITPPVGVNVYIIKGVAPGNIPIEEVFKGTLPYLLLELFTLFLLISFPFLSLWLPSAMKG
jgi:tripartite ATP-independent transporter DctM subunit